MDTLFYNGKIITMAEETLEEAVRPEAVLISNGLIKKVGSLEEVSRGLSSDVRSVDLQGKCLMPSFIDAHSHIVMNGQMSLTADLSECCSFEDIIDTLKQYAAEHKITNREIIVGFGYDHNFLKEQAHPDKRILDKASTDIPIIIIHVSGHLYCANSVALNLAGISQETENPPGGRLGRICGSNEPSGYMEEAGIALLQPVMQERIHIDAALMMEKMQDVYIRQGITTVQDGASTKESFTILKQMADLGKLKTDVVSYPLINADGTEIFEKNRQMDQKYRNHLKLGGYKIILDGSPQGRSAWLSEPYENGSGQDCGCAYYDDETVKKYLMQAVQERKQILAHCNGDAASEQFLNTYEQCMEIFPDRPALRPVMIHCQTVRNDQLDRMAKLHMIASIFVGHVWYWGDVHQQNLGTARGNHISPVKDAMDRKVTVNFHQDTPVTKPNMLHSVWCAVNRTSRTGKKIGKEQKISVYDALKAVTINAAYQYFEENLKGSIEEGKAADLVILDDSPLEIEAERIKDIRVLETIKDGNTIFCAGKEEEK